MALTITLRSRRFLSLEIAAHPRVEKARWPSLTAPGSHPPTACPVRMTHALSTMQANTGAEAPSCASMTHALVQQHPRVEGALRTSLCVTWMPASASFCLADNTPQAGGTLGAACAFGQRKAHAGAV